MADKPSYEELELRLQRLEQENTALQQSEERFRLLSSITENMSESVVATDGDFKITYLNKKAEELFGYRLEELRGQSPDIFNAESSANDIQSKLYDTVSSGGIYTGAHLNKRKDGETFFCEFKVFPLFDEGNKKFAYVGIQRDVTEKKQALEAIRDSEQKFRSLFEAMDAGCCIDEIVYRNGKAVDYRIVDVNPAYSNIMGIPRQKAVGSLGSQVYGTGKPPYLDILSKVAQTGIPTSFEDFFAPVGKYLQFTVSRPSQGRFSTLFQDISKSKEADFALKRSESELRILARKLMKAQEDERRKISHELHDDIGQRLLALKLELRHALSKESADQSTSSKYFEGILDSISEIIDDVRRISREMSPAVLDNFGLAEAFRCLIRQMTSHNGFRAETDFGEIDGILPKDTELAVFRIFQEAITNIIRHADASRIVLTGKEIENELKFELHDDGKGFDLSNAMNSDVKNRGLGLVSIYERARAIDGSLEVRSSSRFGTAITLRIPIQ